MGLEYKAKEAIRWTLQMTWDAGNAVRPVYGKGVVAQ